MINEYIVLTNNNHFPTNKPFSFTTDLNKIIGKSINLNRYIDYEVALIDIKFKIDCSVHLPNLTVRRKAYNKINSNTEVIPSFSDFENKSVAKKNVEGVKNINLDINDYSTGYQLFEKILSQVSLWYSSIDFIDKIFYCDQINNLDNVNVHIDSRYHYFYEINPILKAYIKKLYTLKDKTVYSFQKIRKTKFINICTNLINSQICLNQNRNVLKTIQIKGSAEEVIYQKIKTPEYKLINKKVIDNIEIEIRDEDFNLINLVNDIVITIHIRKRR